jgi:hypothetical protein
MNNRYLSGLTGEEDLTAGVEISVEEYWSSGVME